MHQTALSGGNRPTRRVDIKTRLYSADGKETILELTALLDPGSEVTCVDLDSLPTGFTIDKPEGNVKVTGAGSSLMSLSGTVPGAILLEKNFISKSTIFYVIRNLSSPVILGADFLRAHQATFRYSDQTVELILPQQNTIRLPILQQPSPQPD